MNEWMDGWMDGWAEILLFVYRNWNGVELSGMCVHDVGNFEW